MAPDSNDASPTARAGANGPADLTEAAVANGQDTARRVRQTALNKIHSAANFLHDHASSSPLGQVADNVASGLDHTASYVDSASLDTAREDLRGLIHRYPLRALAVGLGIGVVVGRLMQRR